jgi:hypothetical protein
MKYQHLQALVVIFAATTQLAHSESNILLNVEQCKQETYERLIAQDRVTDAFAIKFSKSLPVECKILLREQTRRTAIEQPDYFTSKNGDKSYRSTLVAGEDKSKFRAYDFQIGGNILSANPSSADQRKTSIDQVRGYISISGKK